MGRLPRLPSKETLGAHPSAGVSLRAKSTRKTAAVPPLEAPQVSKPKKRSRNPPSKPVNKKIKISPEESSEKTTKTTTMTTTTTTKNRKRGRPETSNSNSIKRIKLDFRQFVKGDCFTVGAGDTGQLGLGEDILSRKKPSLVKCESIASDEGIIDVVAGGMHSLILTSSGQVWSFGCNDDGALGRVAESEEECSLPGMVHIPEKVVQITAGDSHSVCLTEDGKAYYWGTFRDSSGSFGLTPEGKVQKLPLPLAHHLIIKKISSGTDHVALLATDGSLYTLGCAEQGQLGRVGERFTARGGRRGLTLLLVPNLVHAKKRSMSYKDVWAGSYNTFALSTDGDILVCGLNNYHQLGIKSGTSFFTLVKAVSFSDNKWAQIALGQHHTLALDHQGKVYALGRNEYGRLGLGEACEDAKIPTLVTKLADKKIVDVSCGTTVSFAVSETGECFSWGMGTNGQLGHDDDDDSWTPQRVLGKQLESKKVLLVSGGGQHAILLAA